MNKEQTLSMFRDLRLNISKHHELCQQLDRSAQRDGMPFVCVCGQALRDKEAEMSESDRRRLQRMRLVTRDFFADKPPGTTIEEHDLDAYYQRLRAVAHEEDS